MPRLTLFKKILVITLLLSLLPLIASSLILFFNLESTSARLSSEIGGTADIQVPGFPVSLADGSGNSSQFL